MTGRNPTIRFSPTGTFATEQVGTPPARGPSRAATASILPDAPCRRRPPFPSDHNQQNPSLVQRRAAWCARGHSPQSHPRAHQRQLVNLLTLLPGLYAVAHIALGWIMGAMM